MPGLLEIRRTCLFPEGQACLPARQEVESGKPALRVVNCTDIGNIASHDIVAIVENNYSTTPLKEMTWLTSHTPFPDSEIGRASCRGRVEVTVVVDVMTRKR